MLKQFVINVRDRREAAGLTQEKLSIAAGLSRGYVNLLESEKRQPNLSTIIALARALKTQPTHLMPCFDRRRIDPSIFIPPD